MRRWFVDASVLLASEDPDDEHHQAARRIFLSEDSIATLDLAFYEVANVAIRSWQDVSAAGRLRQRVLALAEDGGVVRADGSLLADAEAIALEHHISLYDAAYVAGSRRLTSLLISCDIRDLVSNGLARRPADASSH